MERNQGKLAPSSTPLAVSYKIVIADVFKSYCKKVNVEIRPSQKNVLLVPQWESRCLLIL